MKVLMLNAFDNWGGAAKSAYRLNLGVQKLGIESPLLVQFKDLDENNVYGPRGGLIRILNGLKSHIDSLPVRLTPNKPQQNFTPAFVPNRLVSKILSHHPDIIHLHWLGAGLCCIESLRKLNRPIIWTLHDSWAFTGGCHVPFDCDKYQQRCGACPVLGSSQENDLSRWVWKRKQNAWEALNMTVVAPSHWLAGCARSSSLFQNVRVEVIPNGLDPDIFKPIDQHFARKKLGLPLRKKLILFGAFAGTSDKNKGYHLLIPALEQVLDKVGKNLVDLVVFGADKPKTQKPLEMNTHYLGRIYDETDIALLFSAVDVFVAPSLRENLPNTIMEAMACGTPCVAFNQGGVPDLIEHGENGYLAKPYVVDDLANGISQLLVNNELRGRMACHSRRKVEEDFSLNRVAESYSTLYREILV